MTAYTYCQGATRAFVTRCRQLAARARSVVLLRRRLTPHAEATGWVERLQTEEHSLLALVEGMEAEFLATGDGLERLAAQLTQIQGESQRLTDLTLGHSEDAAVQFTFQLLKKAEDLVLASYDQYDHVFAMFGELGQRLTQLSQRREELMRVLLPLNFITMAFRIEASRHPVSVQEAFFTLATTVNQTVDDVRSTMERQFADLAASESLARRLIENISASIQQHREQVIARLDSSRAQLRVLNDSLVSCKAGSADLAQLNQTVNRHIGGIVMAQQCHDITRQTIEHVAEAMVEMRAHLAAVTPENPAPEAEARQFVFRAGQIQLHQVQNVFNQLNTAAGSLKSGMQNLRTDAGVAAAAAVKMGGTTLDAQVARECQTGIGEILGIVQQAVQKIADIIAAFEPLQASFIDCTGKATSLAGDVRHAGLNAQVFAIHAPDGATLEVLAGRVRMISEDVIHQVGEMRAALSHTAAMVTNLRNRLEDFRILGQAEEETLTAESALSRQKLAALESAIPVLIQRISRQQETFAESVEEVLENVRFPETIAAVSPRSLAFFQDLVAWGGQEARPAADEAAMHRKIEGLKTNYTMASEHHAHAAIVSSAGNALRESASDLFEELPPPAANPASSPVEVTLLPVSSADPLPAAESVDPQPPPVLASPENEGSKSNVGLGDNVELF